MALAHQHPRLLEEAHATLQASLDKAHTAAPPKPTEHWAIAATHAGIEHAGLVIVNLRDRAQHDCGQALLAEHGDVVVRAVHPRAHEIGHAGAHSGELPVRALNVAKNLV